MKVKIRRTLKLSFVYVFPWKLNFPVDEKILENMKRVQMFLNAQKGYPNRAVMIRGQYRISHIIQL